MTERPRIVLAEDDPHIGVLVEFALESLGVSVERVQDGEAALARLLLAPSPAAAILDLALPGRDGLDVLASLRAAPATADLPVLVLSARHGGGAPDRVRALGARFLGKPFVLDELEAAARELLRVAPPVTSRGPEPLETPAPSGLEGSWRAERASCADADEGPP